MRIKTLSRTSTLEAARRAPVVGIVATLFVLIFLLPWSSASGQTVQGPPEVTPAVHHDVSPPLRDIPPLVDRRTPHEKFLGRIHPSGPLSSSPDPVVQSSGGPAVATTAGFNFDGVGVGFTGPAGSFTPNAAPPDTNGAVGATQYVQWVNESFAVFDKTTGAAVYGPAAGNTLWTGFGGGCETNNDGDPIAQYDKAANRWVMTQFSVSTTPYLQCVAVSTSSDATGTYNRYAFQMPNFPDYPKLGVWPDAYYMSFNVFEPIGSFFIFVGARICAFDRSAMLSGPPAAATQQCFQLSSSFGGLLPSDLDGATAPPAGSPNFFLNFGSNSLNFWQFHVDWLTPTNTTLTGPTNIPVAGFSEACNGGTCIPQLGTRQQLDSLGDRLMYRLAYRNFGDHESLVVNHSVAAGSSVGVRWYEIRSPATPTVSQQGTYAPDSNFRWMGSIGMDKVGNIALGYSVSSSSINPAIRYTGRLPSDLPNTLEGETSIIEGTGSQTKNLNRWGDYSSISIDPVDDCTFWYTTEYLKTYGTFNWSTRIASFKFPSCGTTATPDFSISATPPSQTVVQGSSTTYTVSVTALNGFTGTVTFSASGLPAGASASFSPPSVAGSGSSTMTVTTASTTPAGTYNLTITGTSGTLVHSTTVTLIVNAAATGDFSLAASPGSQTVTQGSGTSYTVTVTSLNSFSGSVNLSASGVPAGATTSFNPNPVSVPASGSASSTLTVATSTSTPAGTYTLTITGTSGSLSHSTTVTLVVSSTATGDFSVSASPTTRNVTHGSSTSYTVTVSSSGGFTGDVTLSVTGLPSNSVSGFSANPVTGGSGSSTLAISTSSTTPTGSYALTITGTSGSLSHSVSVNLNVR